MARSNKEGQINRTKHGEQLEAYACNAIQSTMEQHRLDQDFDIRRRHLIRRRFPGATLDYKKIIDLVIIHVKTKKIVALIGCKTSFRERIVQDLFLFNMLREESEYEHTWFVEIFERENRTDGNIQIMNKMLKEKNTFGAMVDIIYSTRIADVENEAIKKLMEHLKDKRRVL
jgi:hypothetical protein